jgi:hypothetical protein
VEGPAGGDDVLRRFDARDSIVCVGGNGYLIMFGMAMPVQARIGETLFAPRPPISGAIRTQTRLSISLIPARLAQLPRPTIEFRDHVTDPGQFQLACGAMTLASQKLPTYDLPSPR